MSGFEKKDCCILERENWKHLYILVEEEFSGSEDEVIDSPTQFAKRLRHAKNKSSKRQKNDEKYIYIDNCNWIAATTCEVERIFSLCGHIMNPDRQKCLLVCLKH